MKYRPRWFLLALGAVAVAILFSFPVWHGLLRPKTVTTGGAFAYANDDQLAALAKLFTNKDYDKRVQAYYAMLTVVPVPTDVAPTADLTDSAAILSGDFVALDALRSAKGKATIYRDPNDTIILKFEGFNMTNAPHLNIYLCDIAAPVNLKGIKPDNCNAQTLFLLKAPLKGTAGDQQYDLPKGMDLKPYRSVVIYSEDLDMIYTFASLQ